MIEGLAAALKETSKEISNSVKDVKPSFAKDLGTKANSFAEADKPLIEKKGGAYKDLPSNGGENHHMPADSVSPFNRGDGPAINMEKADHRQTESCGNSKEAQEYRSKQKQLIEQDKFNQAQQMDIDDIRLKFPHKYEGAINEMLQYTKEYMEKNS